MSYEPCKVSAVIQDIIERTAPADRVWLEYAYRKHHPILQYLPTKLAEWIGIMRARCYPFHMLGHRFHNKNPQVHN